jgi:lipid A 3-O-deacylase
MNKRILIALMLGASGAASAQAADWRPQGAFVEAGVAPHATYKVTAGLVWPWSWRGSWHTAQLTGTTEAYLSEWSAQDFGQRRTFTQVGLLPLVRLRFRGGASPWFVEGGIGVSLMSPLYRTSTRTFSTSFNFVDTLGIGRSLDAQHRHELSLRLQHFSNADIKRPNPGENFLQLRYAVAF